jgi:hypothetical protein
MTPEDREKLRRLARGTSFKRMTTWEKVGFGCFVSPIVLVVGWVLYAVVAWAFFPHPQTAEQAACARQGRTCDEDGYPIGIDEETKRLLKRADRDGNR